MWVLQTFGFPLRLSPFGVYSAMRGRSFGAGGLAADLWVCDAATNLIVCPEGGGGHSGQT